MKNPLALHTWTLDTTPLADLLAVARRTGWDAVELRRLDFLRARARRRVGGRPPGLSAAARHLPPRAQRSAGLRDRGREAGGDRVRAVQRRTALRPGAGQGPRPPPARPGQRAIPRGLRGDPRQ